MEMYQLASEALLKDTYAAGNENRRTGCDLVMLDNSGLGARSLTLALALLFEKMKIKNTAFPLCKETYWCYRLHLCEIRVSKPVGKKQYILAL